MYLTHIQPLAQICLALEATMLSHANALKVCLPIQYTGMQWIVFLEALHNHYIPLLFYSYIVPVVPEDVDQVPLPTRNKSDQTTSKPGDAFISPEWFALYSGTHVFWVHLLHINHV